MRFALALAFGSAFIICVLLLHVVRKAAVRWEFVDRPGGRKRHTRVVPLGGGIAICVAACLPLFGAAALSWLWVRVPSLLPSPASMHWSARLAVKRLPVLFCVLAGGLAVAAFGLWDDVKGWTPRGKLTAQFIIAFCVALVPDVRITLFIYPAWVQVAVTTVWLVLMMNCFNLLDNTDGQSGLVAFLTGGALLALALQTGQYFIAGFLLSLLGAVLGFLLFNFPPASIFMGDAGSMFIGYMLAVATTLSTFLTPEQMNPFFPVLVPLVVFAVPIYDTVSVLAIRFHKGQSLLAADRSHFAHRLLRLGMSERMVLLTIGLLVVATSPGATIPYGSETWRVFVPAIQAGAVVLVIVLLELASSRLQRREPPDNGQ